MFFPCKDPLLPLRKHGVEFGFGSQGHWLAHRLALALLKLHARCLPYAKVIQSKLHSLACADTQVLGDQTQRLRRLTGLLLSRCGERANRKHPVPQLFLPDKRNRPCLRKLWLVLFHQGLCEKQKPLLTGAWLRRFHRGPPSRCPVQFRCLASFQFCSSDKCSTATK